MPDDLYALAAAATMQGDPPGPLPAHNPFQLAELLADSPDAGALLAKLAQPRPGPAA